MKAYGYFLKYIEEYEESTIRVEADKAISVGRKKFLTEAERSIRNVMQFSDLFMDGYGIR